MVRPCNARKMRAAACGRGGGGGGGGGGGDGGLHALAADEALGIVDRVGRVQCGLVLGGLTNEALSVGEGDNRRRDAVTLVVCDDLDTSVDVHTNALHTATPRASAGGPERTRGRSNNEGTGCLLAASDDNKRLRPRLRGAAQAPLTEYVVPRSIPMTVPTGSSAKATAASAAALRSLSILAARCGGVVRGVVGSTSTHRAAHWMSRSRELTTQSSRQPREIPGGSIRHTGNSSSCDSRDLQQRRGNAFR
eukprot:COSAG02_NODE_105_length_36393_cov_15.694495_11_plen_250_part_00